MTKTRWTVEQTGGGCTANVARVTDERTGLEFAVVLTDGNLTAWTQSELTEPAFSVGVYAEQSWWGDADDREPVASYWNDSPWGLMLVSTLEGVLADAGLTMDRDAVVALALGLK